MGLSTDKLGLTEMNWVYQTPGGGGGIYHVPFFGVPFFQLKINFGVSFLVKSQVVINFGVSF